MTTHENYNDDDLELEHAKGEAEMAFIIHSALFTKVLTFLKSQTATPENWQTVTARVQEIVDVLDKTSRKTGNVVDLPVH